MSTNPNLEQLFRERRDDFQPTPPQEAWSRIDRRLRPRRRARIRPMIYVLAAVAALAVFAVVSLLLPGGAAESPASAPAPEWRVVGPLDMEASGPTHTVRARLTSDDYRGIEVREGNPAVHVLKVCSPC